MRRWTWRVAVLILWAAGASWGAEDLGQPAPGTRTPSTPAPAVTAVAPSSSLAVSAAPRPGEAGAVPSSTGLAAAPPPSSTTEAVLAPPMSSTLAAAPPLSSTTGLAAGIPVSSTVVAAPRTPGKPAPAAKPTGPPPKPAIVVPYEELHKHASIVIMPSAFSAHYKGPTGENAEVFLAWYIGTLYNEKGLFIAPIFSLFVGADLKWSFIEEHTVRPAFALGYYGGLGQPFTGGAVKASSLAGKQTVKQTFVHDAYLVTGKHFGPVAISGGAMYGFKKAFPLFIPMLRNGSYSTASNPASDTLWTAFGGADVSIKEQHIKVEVITLPLKPTVLLPGETYRQPWLVQTHVDAFLGFDLAYLKDQIGYEVIGYYLLPFYRWPDKKRMEKEAEKLARAKKP